MGRASGGREESVKIQSGIGVSVSLKISKDDYQMDFTYELPRHLSWVECLPGEPRALDTPLWRGHFPSYSRSGSMS